MYAAKQPGKTKMTQQNKSAQPKSFHLYEKNK